MDAGNSFIPASFIPVYGSEGQNYFLIYFFSYFNFIS